MLRWFVQWRLHRLSSKLRHLQILREQGDHKAKQAEIKQLHTLARFYHKLARRGSWPHAELYAFEHYRAAASLDDAEAQYACARFCFDIAKFYEAWGQGPYTQAHHQQWSTKAYQLMFHFLNAAEANLHVEAKRFKGLAYIKGWGVPTDTKQGFQYVLDSIALENAWAKAPQIMHKLGLSTPEFFHALTQYQNQHQPTSK